MTCKPQRHRLLELKIELVSATPERLTVLWTPRYGPYGCRVLLGEYSRLCICLTTQSFLDFTDVLHSLIRHFSDVRDNKTSSQPHSIMKHGSTPAARYLPTDAYNGLTD